MQSFEKIYLRLAPQEFKVPASTPLHTTAVSLELIEKPSYEFYRKWHDDVGKRSSPFSWHSRPRINDRVAIEALLAKPGVEMILLQKGAEPVGYSLTEQDSPSSAEISDFGFLPGLTGQSLGTEFFPLIVSRLIDAGNERIWLSTRSTNHPKVAEFYERFGFKVYKRESIAE